MNQKWLNEIEEAVIEFNEDCIIPKQIILEIISSLRHECEQLQAEQQAHNALREKLKGIYEQCLTKDMWLAVELNNAIKEDSK